MLTDSNSAIQEFPREIAEMFFEGVGDKQVHTFVFSREPENTPNDLLFQFATLRTSPYSVIGVFPLSDPDEGIGLWGETDRLQDEFKQLIKESAHAEATDAETNLYIRYDGVETESQFKITFPTDLPILYTVE